MTLRVIEGGRGAAEPFVPPRAEAVQAEAARRLRESGCEAARVRALLTRAPMPPHLAYLRLQIEFAAAALAACRPVPSDFRADRYWPGAAANT